MPASIPREELKTALQTFAEELGHPPTSTEMAENGPHAPGTYRAAFGSWPAALRAAGLEPQSKQLEKIPADTLLAALETLAEDLGEVPSSPQCRAHGKYCPKTYEERFGSWNDALRAAGLEPVERMNIPDEDLVAALQDVGEHVDGIPRPIDVREHGEFSEFTYYNRFSSWETALAAAGFDTTAWEGQS